MTLQKSLDFIRRDASIFSCRRISQDVSTLSRRANGYVFTSLLSRHEGALRAQCPQANPWFPKWAWREVEYSFYSVELPLPAMQTAVLQWNSIQGFVQFTPTYDWWDIVVYDRTLDLGTIAETAVYNQAYGTCYLKRDVCGRCMNESWVYTVDIRVDPNQVAAGALRWGRSLLDASTAVYSHELGHVLSVWDLYGSPAVPAGSVMWQFDDLLRTGQYTAAPQCDGTAVWQGYWWVQPPPGPYCPCSGNPC